MFSTVSQRKTGVTVISRVSIRTDSAMLQFLLRGVKKGQPEPPLSRLKGGRSEGAKDALARVEVLAGADASDRGIKAARARRCREGGFGNGDLGAGGCSGRNIGRCLDPDIVMAIITDFFVAELIGRALTIGRGADTKAGVPIGNAGENLIELRAQLRRSAERNGIRHFVL